MMSGNFRSRRLIRQPDKNESARGIGVILGEGRERLRLRKLGWKILAIVVFSELLTGLAVLGSTPPLNTLLVSVGVVGLLALGVPGWGLLLAIWTAAPLDISLLLTPTGDFRLTSVALAIYAGFRILDFLRRRGLAGNIRLALIVAWLLGLFLANKIRFPSPDETIFSQPGEGVSIVGLLVVGAALVAGVFSKINDGKDFGLAFIVLMSTKIPVSFLPLIFGFHRDDTYLFRWRSDVRLEYPGSPALDFALYLLVALTVLYFIGDQLPVYGVVILYVFVASGLVLTGSRAAFLGGLFLLVGHLGHSFITRNRKEGYLAASYLSFLGGLAFSLALFPPTRSWGPVARLRKMGFVDSTRAEEFSAYVSPTGDVINQSGYISTHNGFLEVLGNFGFFGGFLYLLLFIFASRKLAKSYGAVRMSIGVLPFVIFAQFVDFFMMPIVVLLVGMYLSISTVRVEPVGKGPVAMVGNDAGLVPNFPRF